MLIIHFKEGPKIMTNEKKRKLNKKYLWSFFTVILVIDFIITLLLFMVFSKIQISKVHEYSTAQLLQVCTMADILFDSVNSISNQVLQDKSTSDVLNAYKIDRLKEVTACRTLRNMQSANSYMRYINFYNAKTNRYISSSCVGFANIAEIDFYNQILGSRKYACVFRNIGEDYSMQSRKNSTAYTFVFKVASGLIIIDVDGDYWNNILADLRVNESEQTIVILDAEGNVISSQTASAGESNFIVMNTETALDNDLLVDEDIRSGSYTIVNEKGIKEFISYAKSNNTKWTIINQIPYETVLSGLNQIGILTVALFLLVLSFGFIVSVKMSKVLYAPIYSLYENYVSRASSDSRQTELQQLDHAFSEMYSKADRLEQGLISAYNDSRKLYLQYLLNGTFEGIQNFAATCKRLGINLNSPFYTMILISCSEPTTEENREQYRNTHFFVYQYALENITVEVISKFGNADILRTGENDFAVLLSLNQENLPQNFAKELDTIPEVMKREFSMEVTVCIGRLVESYQDINMCYESTKISLKSSACKHHGTVFFSAETSDTISTDQYFNKLHSKIADFVRNENIDACSSEFDVALSSVQNISFGTAKAYFSHVMMSVMDEFSTYFEHDNSSFTAFMQQLENIDHVKNVRDMKKSMIQFLTDLINHLRTIRKAGNQNAVNQVCEYLNNHYANPDLSLSMLAEMVGLSPAYLGKVFALATTFTFNDYLNNARMNQAAELLKNTDLSINEISKKVGILNTNYFYSVFKKRYQMTPSRFRQKM